MSSAPPAGRAFGAYLVTACLAVTAHGLLRYLAAEPRLLTHLTYVAVAAAPVVATLSRARLQPPANRPAARYLLAMLVTTTVGNLIGVAAAGRPALAPLAEGVITVGHVLALCSALSVVRRRGRGDIGGVIDTAVLAVALAGAFWTVVLEPATARLGDGQRAALLLNLLILVGVLGALARVAQRAGARIPALNLIIGALLCALAGDVVLALGPDQTLATNRPWPVEVLFLMTYSLLGAMILHPTGLTVSEPGPPAVERLGRWHLVFLGLAMILGPAAAFTRGLAGAEVDWLLLSLGTTLTVPLVMTRIGLLTRDRDRAERELRRAATRDGLTGLVNRVEFVRRLDAAMTAHRAGGPVPLVFFLDLDGFKAVNDELGHASGDALLVTVAQRLEAAVKHGDTVARFGGDEFLVIATARDVPRASAGIADRIEAAVTAPYLIAGQRVRVGVSVGVVAADQDGDSQAVISLADVAMYHAKRRRHEERGDSPAACDSPAA